MTTIARIAPPTFRPVLAALALSLIAFGTAFLTGCNTTEGVGRDIKAAGNGIENAAEKAK